MRSQLGIATIEVFEKKQASGSCSERIWSRGGQRPFSQKSSFLFACFSRSQAALLSWSFQLPWKCSHAPHSPVGLMGSLWGPLLQRNKCWQHQLKKRGVKCDGNAVSPWFSVS